MKSRPITTEQQLRQASQDLLKLGGNLPIVITVTEGTKIRTNSQNARYWSEVAYFQSELNEAISQAANDTGHTEFEIKKILAEKLPVEQSVILFARKPEVVHEVLKGICNIDSSVRLGTKAFSRFDEILAQTMAEIIGSVRSALR